MLGIVFALLSAASFAANGITVRRGVLASSASQGLYISVVMGVPLFLIGSVVGGELGRAAELTPLAYLGLAAAGVLHFLFGRYCNYRAVGAIGATRVEPIRSTSLLYSVGFAVLVLNEALSPQRIAGIALVATAALLMVQRPKRTAPQGDAAVPPTLEGAAIDVAARSEAPAIKVNMAEGYLFGLLAAAAYGLSPVLIRASLEGTGLGTLGGLVSYVAATGVLLLTFLLPGRAATVRGMGRGAAVWFFLAGFTVFLAQFFRYLALAIAPVVVVTPLIQTSSVFTLVFSWLVNRRLETFGPRVVVGVVLSVLGAIAVVL